MHKPALKAHLHECLRREVMMSERPFSWSRTLHKALKSPSRRYNFWWRIASRLYSSEHAFCRKMAHKIQRRLISRYGTEIQLGATIGPGLFITHHQGIVINGHAVIGHTFRIRQNVTIGLSGRKRADDAVKPQLVIGNAVSVGANSCIIADHIHIGDNVVIGAMTFVNRDIPSDHTVYTARQNALVAHRSDP